MIVNIIDFTVIKFITRNEDYYEEITEEELEKRFKRLAEKEKGELVSTGFVSHCFPVFIVCTHLIL
jgi:hypothetical protein